MKMEIGYPLPAVEEFVASIGYDGPARWVGVFWGGGDEAYYCDGRITATGEWRAYLSYVDHPRIAEWLGERRYQLGSSEEEATHCLVLDRQNCLGYVMAGDEAERLLHSQWPKEKIAERLLTMDEFYDLMQKVVDDINKKQAAKTQEQIIDEAEAQMAATYANYEKLVEALNLDSMGRERN